ncbi:sorbosone dehydrogenase [Erythrobacter sp. QSSC1-22B]|uniref:PQQ-dependent sugar dehydrogenase n=1 Tax=Erythrobacter sp. QSSC1-22B TaxID=1860125 RepID=UPI000805AD13|nr:PQQ-dependent sugar dehydrogenase [Erythrobacter sp. QSSC1-22B]OBX19985.1 sorbosone dehydrogenase [Erythrobacter sp. QSSC1-22B]
MTIGKKILIAILVLILLLFVAAAFLLRGDRADLSVAAVAGTDPTLQEPDAEGFPTVQIAEPVGWAADEVPQAAEGLAVTRFADGLDHPRTIHTLPNGDVLVALTGKPGTKPEDANPGILDSIESFIAGLLMGQAGAGGDPANEIALLRDTDGDGRAEVRETLLDGLDSPSGMAWRDGTLYVANHDAVLAYSYELGAAQVSGEARKLMDLSPGGGHWMRNLELHPQEDLLYVAVGSVSNIGDQGMEAEEGRALIWEYNLATGTRRVFGAGLRNPNGLDFSPWSGELWTTVNERDMLGSDLVPDYLTNVPVGAQYGWPWVYWKNNFDRRVDAPMPAYLSEYARRPEYALGPHVAALGFVFSAEGSRMGERFGQGAFIAQHGSWNRKPASGYDVVYVAFDERGNPQGLPVPVLSGFLQDDGTTRGRPTWAEWAGDGSLLVSDDTAGIIWRVIAPGAEPAPAIDRLNAGSLPPQRELTGGSRGTFREEYARRQAAE